MIPVGVQLYTVLDQLQEAPEATLSKLRQIGYREVEAVGGLYSGGGDLRVLVENAKLTCPSVHMPFASNDTASLLEEACSLGAQYVVSPVLFPTGRHRNDADSMYRELNSLTGDDFRRIADRANRIGSRARDMGLRYAYHNHNFEFKSLPSEVDPAVTGYLILLDYTDPALVHFEADCGWMEVAGVSAVELLRSFPGRTPLLHIKDFDLGESACTVSGVTRRTRPLGQGQIDHRALLRSATGLGVKHIFVERDPPISEGDGLKAVQQDYEYIRSILPPSALG